MKFYKHIPNCLTGSRILLAPLVCVLIYRTQFAWALFSFFLVASTDFLDGSLARYLKVTSEPGAFFDPIADKILIFSAFAALMVKGLCPPWFLGVIIAVTILQCIGYWVFHSPESISKARFETLRIGKWNITLQYLWIGTLLLEPLISALHANAFIPWWNFSIFLTLSGVQVAVFFSYFFYFRIHLTPDFRLVFPTHA